MCTFECHSNGNLEICFNWELLSLLEVELLQNHVYSQEPWIMIVHIPHSTQVSWGSAHAGIMLTEGNTGKIIVLWFSTVIDLKVNCKPSLGPSHIIYTELCWKQEVRIGCISAACNCLICRQTLLTGKIILLHVKF